MKVTRDLYDVLGVGRDADAEAVKRAYRSRARKLHPDVSPDPKAGERFAELGEAYRVLSSPAARLLYDRYGYVSEGAAALPGSDAEPEGAPPAFALGEVEIDSLEALRGRTRKAVVRLAGPCTACGGTGAGAGGATAACATCAGAGRLRRSSALGTGQLVQFEPCPDCGGSGERAVARCAPCGGTGRSEEERTLEVRVPRGAVDGEGIWVEGDREAGRPDLYVVLRVRPYQDARGVRYAAALGLVLALALFAVLLVAPELLPAL